MKERSFDEMIAYFNRRVADMNISQDCKMELLGMVTALGYKHEKTAPQWIPCSERLPEDNVPVKITWINRKPEFYYAEIKDVPFTATGVYFKGKWYWYSSTVEDYLAEYGAAEWDEIEEAMHNSIEVVAWMPLPEPWRGEDDAQQDCP